MTLIVTPGPEPQKGTLSFGEQTCICALGRGGVNPDKREGDGATPAGTFPLRRVFYRPDRVPPPDTALTVIPINGTMGWCDDPASPAYNTLITLPCQASHETMWRDDHAYDVVVELGYNDDPVVAGAGSAIFLHVARPDFSPTDGCVALKLEDLRDVLGWVRVGDALSIALA